MRQDSEIKSDVISELEDLGFGPGDEGVLDQLMIEEVQVDAGVVSVALVFEDDCPDSERGALIGQVREVCADLEGVVTVAVRALSVSELGPDSGRRGARAAAPIAAAPGANGGSQTLTLAAFLGGITEPVVEAAPTNLYSGGGCEAGTAVVPPTSVVRPAPAPAPAVQTLPSPAASEQMISIPVREYRELIRAQRELELRPTLQEHREALATAARFEALASALRAVLDSSRAD